VIARVQVVKTGPVLRVIFHRLGEEPQVMIARDGEHAWQHAVALIAAREELVHGDVLTVRKSHGEGDAA
jgi:hypothetical protein